MRQHKGDRPSHRAQGGQGVHRIPGGGIGPAVGRKPTTPLKLAGIRQEPPKSVLRFYATMAKAAQAAGGDWAKSLFVSESYLSTTTVLYKKGGFTEAEIGRIAQMLQHGPVPLHVGTQAGLYQPSPLCG